MVRVCLRFCFLLVLAVSATVWGTGCSKSEGPATCQTNNDCIDGQRCVKRACKEVETQTDKPIAQIKAPTQVRGLDEIELDGSGSKDPNGESLTYTWTLLSKPGDSQAEITKATETLAGLKADKPGNYKVQLVVKNTSGVESDPAEATINVVGDTENSAPIADAGFDAFGGINDTLTLDGSGSSDPNGDTLTYKWSFKSKPDGSQADFSDPTIDKPQMTFDKAGKYIIQLVVNDGTLDSDPDSVSIEILDDFNLEPKLTQLDPNEGSVDTTHDVLLKGEGFSQLARVLVDGTEVPTTQVTIKSQTEIELKLDLQGKSAKNYNISVRNPNKKESAALPFKAIDLPTPTLTSVDPPSGLTGAKYTITLTGTGFVKVSEVLFNLIPLPTTYKSATTLEAKLDLSQTPEGTYNIKVRSPGGRSSQAITFQVQTDGGFPPILNVLNPPQGTVGTTIPFSVHGTSFAPGAVIIFDGKEIPSLRQSRDTIEADPSLDLTNIPVGKYNVWVRNANGKESSKEVFEVIEKDPPPQLDRILPPTVYLNDVNKLDVYGKFFDPKVKIYIGSQEFSGSSIQYRSTTFFSATIDTKQGNWSAGNVQAYVINPNNKKSQTFTLTFTNKPTEPPPVLVRVNPTTGESGKTISSFYIYANNMCPKGCTTSPTVFITDSNNVDVQAKHNVYTSIKLYTTSSSPYMRGTLNMSSMPAGTYKIQIEQAGTKVKSNTVNFTVKPPPGIAIDRLSPTTGDVGTVLSDFRIYADYFCTASGSSCASLPKIFIKDSNNVDYQAKHNVFKVTSSYVSGSSPYIKGTLDVTKMPLGTYTFQLEHATTKKLSNTKTFRVQKPIPLSLSYVYPYYATSGQSTKCDVNGGPFTSASYVLIGTDKIPLLSGTSTTRRSFNFDTVSKYKTPGLYTMRVCNSATQCSNPFAYTVVSSTATDPFLTSVKGDNYPMYINTTFKLYIYGYRWGNAAQAQFFIDGKELNTTNFKYTTRTCKLASKPTSSSNCIFEGFSTVGLKEGKHTIQYKWNNTTSIVYEFYLEKP